MIENPFFLAGRELWLYNRSSAFICIIRCPLWRCAERFSSPFIFYVLGTQGRRLTSHNISNHITCDRSNVVIILGPYSFPGNECKSTPSLLASDSSWQRGCSLYNHVSFSLFLSMYFWKAYPLLPSLFLRSSWVASSGVSFGLIFNWAFEAVPWGGCWLVRDRCRLCANPERVRCGYHLHGGRERSGRPSPTSECAVMKVMWQLNGND